MLLVSRWFVGVTLWLALVLPGSAQEIVINEVMAAGQSVLADEEGSFPDWIELHNPTDNDIQLGGWHLTDSAEKPEKWSFPDKVIPAGGYLVVFASGKTHLNGPQLHANFSLRSGGEYLALTRPDGSVETSANYPVQMPDVSYEPANERFYSEPTPGAPNTTVPLAIASAPDFSVPHGYWESPFDLTLEARTENAQIRYTLDGTEPTATTGLLYSGPIRVEQTSVIRAAAFAEGAQPSAVVTRTYLFARDIVNQSPDGKAPKDWPRKWGMNRVDYGMDPRITQRAPYKKTMEQDLQTIPALSIVMDLDDLFDPVQGIYANPSNKGREWERPMSIERIEPTGGPGFQVNAGLRIRGGASRDTGNPKHSFRVIFRKDYGAPELEYPLFGATGAQRTSAFDIRCEQLIAWHYFVDPNADFIRDIYGRDTQGALGQPHKRGDFHHLFINGQYWGLYQTDERVNAEYAAEYFGGNSEEYDVVKFDAESNFGTGFTDGTFGSWSRLFDAGRRGFADSADYFKVQGLNPDGSRNREFERLLDVDNLIDYMLAGIFIAADDSPPAFGTQNNWYGLRSRKDDFGFRFFAHDWEISMFDPQDNRVGPAPEKNPLEEEFLSPGSVNPWFYWQALRLNPEFRLRVADHVQKYFFNDGPLTKEVAKARWLSRMEEIDRAIVGESARWGDARQEGIGPVKNGAQIAAEWLAGKGRDIIIDPGPRPGGPGNSGGKKRPKPFTREDWFAAANDRVLEGFLEVRSDAVLQHLKDGGLFPALPAPVITPFGGDLPPDGKVTISVAESTLADRIAATEIFYTTDGSDPRRIGGEVSPTATRYVAPFPLVRDTVVKARARAAGEWSALTEVTFTPATNYRALRLTEIQYNPRGAQFDPSLDNEFLELKNTGTVPLDLSGASFTAGITYTFPVETVVQPGAFVVLARDLSIFHMRFPDVTPLGTYEGRLNDDGETITLNSPTGARILSVTYDDETPWPLAADGIGFSLVWKGEGDPDRPTSWRASASTGGSPGEDDPVPPQIPKVVINEVLTKPAAGQSAALELYNAGPTDADISGWWVSDDLANAQKYQIPSGTVIPAGGYLVFTAEQLRDGRLPVTLDPLYGFAWLTSATPTGVVTGYVHGFQYYGALEGHSFSRYINSVGEESFPLASATTLGAANAGPMPFPVRISEIHYFPAPGGDEFVELENTTDAVAPIDSAVFGGLGFAPPVGAAIPPFGRAVLCTIDPAVFRTKYQVPAEVPVYGPAEPGTASLQDNGERLSFRRPIQVDNTGGVITWDSVRYDDRRPWPTAAAGFGASLQRVSVATYGDDPQSWIAAEPTPGVANNVNAPPRVRLTSPADGATIRPPQAVLFAAEAGDVDGTVARVQFLVDNVVVGEDTEAPFTFAWRPTGGLHDLTARAFDNKGASTESEFITIDVDAPNSGIGLGLRGEYFRSPDFTGAAVVRDDANVAFDWMERPPMPDFPKAGYSVRWTGRILPRSSGDHLIFVRAAGGVRLFLNNELVIDQTDEPGGIVENAAMAPMVAGEAVELRMEYLERDGAGFVELRWAEPGAVDSAVLSQNQLYLPSQDSNALGIASNGDLPARYLGRGIRTQLQAVNGTPPYTWSISSGALPAGITLSGRGLLAGTPSESGAFRFTVRVQDADGATAERAFRLKVLDPDSKLLPRVQITAPATGAALSSDTVRAAGFAHAPGGLAELRYSLNDGPWHSFAAARKWAVTLDRIRGLVPGRNILRVIAVDAEGRESMPEQRKFEYIVHAPLKVAVEGKGKVTPSFLGTTQRVLGRDYTITAEPAPGYVLREWRGAFGADRRLTFIMAEGLEITAVFVPIPFRDLAGNYTGFVDALEKKHRTRGAVSLAMTRTGAFTGLANHGSGEYRFRGKFGVEGVASVTLESTKERFVSLNLFWDFEARTIDTRIDLMIGEEYIESRGTSLRAGFDAESDPCPFAGEHSISLTRSMPAPMTLDGTVKIEPDGRATMTTKLSDGTDVSVTGVMRRDGSLVLFASLYESAGSFAGEIKFTSSENEPITGQLFWSKPVTDQENSEVEFAVSKAE